MYSNNYGNRNNDMNNSYSSEDGHLGENLHDVDYSKIELKPFTKVFYQVGKSVHTEEEIAKYQ